MLMDREGVERRLKERQRFLKPTLARQRKAKNAIYQQAKRTKNQLVEELLADPGLLPF